MIFMENWDHSDDENFKEEKIIMISSLYNLQYTTF